MRFRLFGNLEVRDADGVRISLPSKLRTILSLLVVQRAQAIPVASLVDEVWPHDPPVRATATLQTYICQLRKRLATEDARDERRVTLSTEPSGYKLVVAAEQIDTSLFDARLQSARESFTGRDYARTIVTLDRALSLCRSPVLSDVSKGPVLEAFAAQLEEARAQASELRVESCLRLGLLSDATRALKALVVRHPLREGLHAQLMLALHRSGRRDEALATFGRLRRALAEELGIEPSPAIQRLHRAVLAADPVLDPPEKAGESFCMKISPAVLGQFTTTFPA